MKASYFKSQPELLLGKVIKTYTDGTFDNKEDKRLYCDLEVSDGTQHSAVPFYGGGVDPTTKKPHGIFIPPVDGSMVGVFFVGGHYRNPCAAFPIPFDWGQEERASEYYNILENTDEMMIAHKTGSYEKIKEDGSFEKKVNINDEEKSSEIKDSSGNTTILNSGNYNVDAEEVNLNSGTKGAARLDDKVESTTVEDSEFWSWATKYNTFNVSWAASLATLQSSGGTPAGVVAYATSMQLLLTTLGSIPTSLAGKITESSETVKIGD